MDSPGTSSSDNSSTNLPSPSSSPSARRSSSPAAGRFLQLLGVVSLLVGPAAVLNWSASIGLLRRLDNNDGTHKKKTGKPSGSNHSNNHHHRIAVLIAGQCQRFVYQDQTGPLFNFTDDKDDSSTTAAATWEVDVYITLHCGAAVHTPFSGAGTLSPVPYMQTNQTSIELVNEIRHWYQHEHGARRVSIELLDDAHMDAVQRELEWHILDPHHSDGEFVNGTADELRALAAAIAGRLGDRSRRWSAELRKFYLRHRVYARAVAQQSDNDDDDDDSYDGFVFWREDNIFVTPFHLPAVWREMNEEGEKMRKTKNFTINYGNHATAIATTTPLVAVDAACKFGSYSDKMYVANPAGAALLLGRTWVDHVAHMKAYVLFVAYRWNKVKRRKDRGYQPEAFVQDQLSTAVVAVVDLQRVDLRYHHGHRCIAPTYYGCLPAATRDLARIRHGLEACVLDQ